MITIIITQISHSTSAPLQPTPAPTTVFGSSDILSTLPSASDTVNNRFNNNTLKCSNNTYYINCNNNYNSNNYKVNNYNTYNKCYTDRKKIRKYRKNTHTFK